jgi:ATP-dependent protease ClpP protease subunit
MTNLWFHSVSCDGELTIWVNPLPIFGGAGELIEQIRSAHRITVNIDSFGGDSCTASDVAIALEEKRAVSEAHLLHCCSSAWLLASACGKVFMSSAGQGMLHAVRSLAVMGTADTLRQRADELDRLDTVYVGLLASRGGDRALLEGWATGPSDTWLTPSECLAAHLIDEITYEPIAAPTSPAPTVVSNKKEPVWQERALTDFLSSLGPFEPTDKAALFRNFDAWIVRNVL